MSRPIDDGYPIVARLADRPVLVVGGGTIALRKAEGLAVARARLTIVSPEFVDGFDALANTTLVRRRYESGDVDGMVLVVAATNDPAVQQQIFDDGERRHVLVNAVDDPDRCSYILPATVRRGPVIVAVSTQGRSPALAGQLRTLLASALPADLEAIVAEAGRRRDEAHARGESTEDLDWSGLL